MSDPGYELIAAASKLDIPVIPIPGPSAIITALTVSGLPTDRFTCFGFLPHRQSARQNFLKSISGENSTLILLESPHRIQKSLQDILLTLGDRRLAVCREMTKIYEEIFRGTVTQAIAHFQQPRGEFTLVIEGNRENKQLTPAADIEQKLHEAYLAGDRAKEAIARVSQETDLSRKALDQKWLKFPKNQPEIKNTCQNAGRR